jgi:hypothetical protein
METPLLMAIETNGGRTGKFGVIFLLFTEDAQAAWDSPEHLYNHQDHLDDANIAKRVPGTAWDRFLCVWNSPGDRG